MKKAKLLFYVSLLAAFGLIFVFRNAITGYFAPQLLQFENATFNFAVQDAKKDVSVPAPLRVTSQPDTTVSSGSIENKLTIAGTIQWTNIERTNNGGLPALTENSQLDEIAKLRMDDMFQKQYFAHVSPASSSAVTVAGDVGYDYIALGENLALGNFGGDQKLMEAWMNSPGHRANILNSAYQEIGVAVGRGMFEGNIAWLAVQIFGKPASACPLVDFTRKAEINTWQAQLKDMQQTLASLKNEIESARHGTVDQKILQYNALAEQYNTLLNKTKSVIDEYNAEANAYNACINQ
jgi:uncharacterized protein YkwD